MNDFFEEERAARPSKRKAEELRNRLLRLAGKPESEFSSIMRTLLSPRDLLALDAALLGILDDNKRSELTELVLGAMDSFWGERPAGHLPVVLVAIGAFCEGTTPATNGTRLRELYCGGDSAVLRCDTEDPSRPGISAFALAIPMNDFRCLNQPMIATALMLGNEQVPGAVPDDSAWDNALEQTNCPGILYVFAVAPHDCDKSSREWTFRGAHYEQCTRLVRAQVERINRQDPEARATLIEARRFSRAVRPLQEAALAVSIRREIAEFKDRFKSFSVDSDLAKDSLFQERGGLMFFDSVLLSTTVWEDELTQTVDLLVTSPTRPEIPAVVLTERISGLSTLTSLEASLKDVCLEYGLHISSRLNLKSPKPWEVVNGKRVFFDITGHWLPADFAALPNGARALIKSQDWLRTLNADTETDYEEMRRWPFPFLYKSMDIPKRLQAHFTPELAGLILELCAQSGLCFQEAYGAIVERFPEYAFFGRAGELGAGLDVPYEMYLSHHFCKSDGRVFHIKHSLVEMLDFTDIEEGVPVAYLRAPFPDCYFHLEAPIVLQDGANLEDEARVVGYFVTQKELETERWRLAIGPVLTFGYDMLSAYGQELVLDLEPGDTRGLLQALNDLVPAEHRDKRLTSGNPMYQVFNMCAKVLLYLGLRSARLVNRPEKTALLERSKAPGRSSAERKRDAQRAAKLYDYIEVGPGRSMTQEHGDETRERGKVFWRRGFFRMQAYGPRWSMHRQQWIQPTLVNADMLSEGVESPAVRDYSVRGTAR